MTLGEAGYTLSFKAETFSQNYWGHEVEVKAPIYLNHTFPYREEVFAALLFPWFKCVEREYFAWAERVRAMSEDCSVYKLNIETARKVKVSNESES